MEQDPSHQNCAALARSVCTHVAGLTAHSVTLASGREQFACPALVTPLRSTFGSLRQSTRMSLTAFRYEVFGKVCVCLTTFKAQPARPCRVLVAFPSYDL